jgi:hypothetical protein
MASRGAQQSTGAGLHDRDEMKRSQKAVVLSLFFHRQLASIGTLGKLVDPLLECRIGTQRDKALGGLDGQAADDWVNQLVEQG